MASNRTPTKAIVNNTGDKYLLNRANKKEVVFTEHKVMKF
jgi:hypothetical protein